MEIGKVDLKSLDLKQHQLEKLKEIFPEAFIEGNKVDWDKLRLTLGENIDTGKERFGMNWPGKADCFKTIQQPSIGTLIPDRDESINFDTTQNTFIEGDNLEALKLLQKAYLGKIKMIYIDPPYNTGEDFIYPDNYNETLDTYLKYTGQIDNEGRKYATNPETDGRFHSKWMNMIYSRLYIAKNLLKDEGVVVIHMDEHEIVNLTIILNELFGPENNLGTIIWDKGNPKGDAKGVAIQHEYLTVFAKNKEAFVKDNSLEKEKENADRILRKAKKIFSRLGKDDYPDAINEIIEEFDIKEEIFSVHKRKIVLEDINSEFNAWMKKQGNLSGGEKAYILIDKNGDVFQSVSMAWPNKKEAPEDYFTPLIHPLTKKECPVPERGWRYPSESMKKYLEKNEIIFGQDESTQPRRKYLLKDNKFENLPSIIFYGGSDDKLFKELKLSFDNPKPLEFAKLLLKIFLNKKDDIVIDFFAGSGTTAHAVLELNSTNNLSRKFICAQLPQPTEKKSAARKQGFETISQLCVERIKRSILRTKLKFADKNNLFTPVQAEADLGFKVFKLSPSNFNVWDTNVKHEDEEITKQLQLNIHNLSEQALEEAILFELLLKSGFELTIPVQQLVLADKKVYSIANDAMLICLDKKLNKEVLKAIADRQPSRVICLDAGFNGSDELKTNAVKQMESKGVVKFMTV
ncbi:MAG: site-specific DNA-methyltransferase [Bacteroidia bacterium]